MRATCTGKESMQIKDLDMLTEQMARPRLTAMGLVVIPEVGKIGTCNMREF